MEDEVTLCVGEEAVRRWAHAKKLSSRTTDAIINMGYTSMEALSLLTEEDVTDCQDIPVGQRRLLVHSIVGTFPLGPTGPSPEVQENEFIRNVLGQLHGPIPTSDSNLLEISNDKQ